MFSSCGRLLLTDSPFLSGSAAPVLLLPGSSWFRCAHPDSSWFSLVLFRCVPPNPPGCPWFLWLALVSPWYSIVLLASPSSPRFSTVHLRSSKFSQVLPGSPWLLSLMKRSCFCNTFSCLGVQFELPNQEYSIKGRRRQSGGKNSLWEV